MSVVPEIVTAQQKRITHPPTCLNENRTYFYTVFTSWSRGERQMKRCTNSRSVFYMAFASGQNGLELRQFKKQVGLLLGCAAESAENVLTKFTLPHARRARLLVAVRTFRGRRSTAADKACLRMWTHCEHLQTWPHENYRKSCSFTNGFLSLKTRTYDYNIIPICSNAYHLVNAKPGQLSSSLRLHRNHTRVWRLPLTCLLFPLTGRIYIYIKVWVVHATYGYAW